MLRSASQSSRMSLARIQSGWLIISALMTLGSSVVNPCLPTLLQLWRNSFPRNVKVSLSFCVHICLGFLLPMPCVLNILLSNMCPILAAFSLHVNLWWGKSEASFKIQIVVIMVETTLTMGCQFIASLMNKAVLLTTSLLRSLKLWLWHLCGLDPTMPTTLMLRPLHTSWSRGSTMISKRDFGCRTVASPGEITTVSVLHITVTTRPWEVWSLASSGVLITIRNLSETKLLYMAISDLGLKMDLKLMV